MQIHIYPTIDALNTALAKWITDLINDTLKTKDRFTFCLSGGSTPKALYDKMASDYHDKIDWQKVHFFWGDERYVPFDDDRNNAAMAYKSLLDKVNVAKKNIHVIKTDVPVETSVQQYQEILHEYLDDHETTFDLVLLGMGEDGHTLSLFPGNEISEGSTWVKQVIKDEALRISLLPAVVNKAASVVFLITGENKSKTLQQVVYGDYKPFKYPSQLIKPLNKNLHYFLDEAAAKNISHPLS